jgi:hypothetical protein
MNINDLTKEELEFIIDNFNTIRQVYSSKYEVFPDTVYFRNDSNPNRESYIIAVVADVDDSRIVFEEFDISNDRVALFRDISLDNTEFLELFTKADMKLQFELLKLYNNKTEDINNIEKKYFNKAKDILHEYKLI